MDALCYLMELTGVEPVSALDINIPFIHRFSLSNPLSGNRHLSPTVGFFSDFLADCPLKETSLSIRWGFIYGA
jgi:hypothetical protein